VRGLAQFAPRDVKESYLRVKIPARQLLELEAMAINQFGAIAVLAEFEFTSASAEEHGLKLPPGPGMSHSGHTLKSSERAKLVCRSHKSRPVVFTVPTNPIVWALSPASSFAEIAASSCVVSIVSTRVHVARTNKDDDYPGHLPPQWRWHDHSTRMSGVFRLAQR
jgi:hypothetical protein